MTRKLQPRTPPPASIARPLVAQSPRAGWLDLLLRYGWAVAALLAIVLYLPTLRYRFVFDDVELVLSNMRIRSLADPARYLATSWWDRPSGMNEYRPATMASFALTYAVAGLRPWAHHLINIILHGVIVAMIWLMVRRFFGLLGPALVAAAVFAIHPVHVESVSAVVGRAELQVTLGFVGAMLAAHASMWTDSRGRRWAWALVAFAATMLSVFSKEHGVLLPGGLALLCLIPGPPGREPVAARVRGAGWRKLILGRVRRVLPAMALVMVAVISYFAARHAVVGAFLRPKDSAISPLDNPLITLEGGPHLMTALSVVTRYAALLVAPFNQSPDYSLRALTPVMNATDPSWVPGAALLALAAFGIYLAWRRPAILFGLLFMLLTFLVSSNLLLTIGTIMAERLLYLPSIGFCIMLAAAGHQYVWPSERGRLWGLALLSLWAAALLVQHALYLPVWRTPNSLAAYMVHRVPDSARAQVAYGTTLYNDNKLDEAIEYLQRGVQIYSGDVAALTLLANMYAYKGDEKKALDYLERVHAFVNSYHDGNRSLAQLLTKRGETARAERILREGLAVDPTSIAARVNLGIWLAEQGGWDEAIRLLNPALRQAVGNEREEILWGLAQSYMGLKNNAAAMPLLQELVRMRPQTSRYQVFMASALFALGHRDEAEGALRQVLSREPQNAMAQQGLKRVEAARQAHGK